MMLKRSLQELPAISLDPGYSLRHYQKNDDQFWENIINESFGGTHNFEKQMRQNDAFVPERVFFICYQGTPVATASAWHSPEKGSRAGSLHMVGAMKAHAGHGLGYAVSLAALYRMTEEGRTRAVLRTDDFRKPAIKTYLKLGFIPICLEESHEERWRTIFLEMKLPKMLEGPLLKLKEYNPFSEDL